MLNLESCQNNGEDKEEVLNKNIKAVSGVIYTAALHLCSQQLSQELLRLNQSTMLGQNHG